jgi:hypothetical protein
VEKEGMDRAIGPDEGVAEIAGVANRASRVVGRVVEGGADQGKRRVGLVMPDIVSASFVGEAAGPGLPGAVVIVCVVPVWIDGDIFDLVVTPDRTCGRGDHVGIILLRRSGTGGDKQQQNQEEVFGKNGSHRAVMS